MLEWNIFNARMLILVNNNEKISQDNKHNPGKYQHNIKCEKINNAGTSPVANNDDNDGNDYK